MEIPPFQGQSLPIRRRFWDEVHAASKQIQKVAGRNVSIDERRGYGTVINVDRKTGGVTGACCIGTDCSITTEAECTESGGTFQGIGTVCDPNPCVGCQLQINFDVCFHWCVQDIDGSWCTIIFEKTASVIVAPDDELAECFLDQDQTPGRKGTFTFTDDGSFDASGCDTPNGCNGVAAWVVGMSFNNDNSGLVWLGTGSGWQMNAQVDVPNFPGGATFLFVPVVYGDTWESVAPGSGDNGVSCDAVLGNPGRHFSFTTELVP